MSEETNEQTIRRLWKEQGSRMFANGQPVWVVPDYPKLKPPTSYVANLAISPDPIRTYEFRRGVEYNDRERLKRYYVECEGVRVAESTESATSQAL